MRFLNTFEHQRQLKAHTLGYCRFPKTKFKSTWFSEGSKASFSGRPKVSELANLVVKNLTSILDSQDSFFYQKREQYKITRSGVTRKLPRQPQKSELPAKGIAEIGLKSHTTTLGLIIARNSNVYFDIDLKHDTQEQPMQ